MIMYMKREHGNHVLNYDSRSARVVFFLKSLYYSTLSSFEKLCAHICIKDVNVITAFIYERKWVLVTHMRFCSRKVKIIVVQGEEEMTLE